MRTRMSGGVGGGHTPPYPDLGFLISWEIDRTFGSCGV